MSELTPIIMAGGTGSRLWPLSRADHPKQFLKLDGEFTMLQSTLHRLNKLNITKPIVISNKNHRFLVADQLDKLGVLDQNIILEPKGKNTAPAIALAAFHLLRKNNDSLMLVLAADHVIKDNIQFQTAIESAIPYALEGKIATFGIIPSHPETGYGYIRRGIHISDNISFIESFVEKPDLSTANDYFESKDYYWNSGMFIFKASTYLQELEKFRPDIYECCSIAVENADVDLDFIRVNEEIFSRCPQDSIDYAIMEKTELGIVIPIDAGWSDVGSWSMLWNISDKDNLGNSTHGDALLHNCNDNYIYSDSGLVAAVGVDNLIIINTKDATLVVNKDNDQDVKKIVDKLKLDNRVEYQKHRQIFRPWGKHEHMDEGYRFKVRRITVNPGEKLSTQMHLHRAEHWIVVCGTAKVTISDSVSYITENESTFIPIGVVHKLENPGSIPLEMIEIQSGSYLEEDDVIRL